MPNLKIHMANIFYLLATIVHTCIAQQKVLRDPLMTLTEKRERASLHPRMSFSNAAAHPIECNEDDLSITVIVQTDAFGIETSWNLTNSNGESIMSVDNFIYDKDEFYKHKICVVEPGCYDFQIADSYNDGICCLYGEGYFQLYFMDSLMATGSNFGSYFSQKICTPVTKSTDSNETVTISPSSNFSSYPTISPVDFPSSSPSRIQTNAPSSNITHSPSVVQSNSSSPSSIHHNSSSPSITPTENSDFPSRSPSFFPSQNTTSIEKSNSPSIHPSPIPSASPSSMPSSSSSKPTITQSFRPSKSPSSKPTFAPSHNSTVEATNLASSNPQSTDNTPSSIVKPPLKGPIMVRGIEMILGGTKKILEDDNAELLENLIANYIVEYYNTDRNKRNRNLNQKSLDFISVRDMVSDMSVSIQLTNQELIRSNNKYQGRLLKASSDLKLTYTQIIQYRTKSETLEIMKIIEDPFLTISRRSIFVKYLKDRGMKIFDEVSEVDLTRRNADIKQSSTANQKLPIIFGTLLIVMIFLFAGDLARRYRDNRKNKTTKLNPVEIVQVPPKKEKVPVILVDVAWGGEEVSTLGGATTSIVSVSDNGTLDYSYTKAFVEDENSLLDSKYSLSKQRLKSIHSGAMTDEPIVDIFSEEISSVESYKSEADAPSNTGNSIFSSTESFDAFFTDENSIRTMKDDVIDIEAPQGRLGVILQDTSGVPTIFDIRETSPILGKVEIGDKLIALDDKDVSFMSSNEVSTLIGDKSENQIRKLTILRRKKR